MNVNFVTFSGNVGADSELRQSQSGVYRLTFSLAVSENRKGADGQWQEATSWIPCVIFGERAAKLQQHITRGVALTLTGKLNTSTYEKDGEKRKAFSVMVDELDIHFPPKAKGQSVADEDIAF